MLGRLVGPQAANADIQIAQDVAGATQVKGADLPAIELIAEDLIQGF
jgi:hypothetical protein